MVNKYSKIALIIIFVLIIFLVGLCFDFYRFKNYVVEDTVEADINMLVRNSYKTEAILNRVIENEYMLKSDIELLNESYLEFYGNLTDIFHVIERVEGKKFKRVEADYTQKIGYDSIRDILSISYMEENKKINEDIKYKLNDAELDNFIHVRGYYRDLINLFESEYDMYNHLEFVFNEYNENNHIYSDLQVKLKSDFDENLVPPSIKLSSWNNSWIDLILQLYFINSK
ncbi:hypothetical protein EZV73_19265 [Acidaminobacter sp. JC074]|uniref:hypothetical protein n=1 Tax=Acidaminobacter sp. JC074 TaxID=2530199 RepID=UPI001F0DD732|nr:hypothetical protein [Acidaminobacter sp. JC074]MCH4889731.1 hypothetical protein [Acidaminobacter sp. JC074]